MKPLSELKVMDLMDRDVLMVNMTDGLLETIKKMGEKKVSAAFVAKEGDNDSVGIITRKDIVIEALENLESFGDLKVSDLATKPIFSIQADLRLDHAIKYMRLAGIRRLAVYDGKDFIGVISNSHIFRHITENLGGK